MKIIKNNYTQTIFPPVTVRCAKCKSIVKIEQGDAALNKHFVWEWKCPCCNRENKSGCQWQLQLVKQRGQRKKCLINRGNQHECIS